MISVSSAALAGIGVWPKVRKGMQIAVLVQILAGACCSARDPLQDPGREPSIFSVRDGDQFIYVDSSGHRLNTPRFANAYDFAEGRARFVIRDPKRPEAPLWGFVGPKGVLIQPKYRGACDFSEGLAAVYSDIDGVRRLGFIDNNGALVIPCEWPCNNDATHRFRNGYAAVGEEDKQWFIDRRGRRLGGRTYDAIGEFTEGLALFYEGNRCGFVDGTGAIRIGPQYERALWFSEGLAPVMKESRWGYIDKNGNMAIAPRFDSASVFSCGLAAVKVEGKYGYIDRSGRFVVPPTYASCRTFAEGVGAAKREAVWGFLDKRGQVIIPFQYDHIGGHFENGLVCVEKQGKWAVIDKAGSIVFGSDFDSPPYIRGATARVERNGRVQLVTRAGEIMWPQRTPTALPAPPADAGD